MKRRSFLASISAALGATAVGTVAGAEANMATAGTATRANPADHKHGLWFSTQPDFESIPLYVLRFDSRTGAHMVVDTRGAFMLDPKTDTLVTCRPVAWRKAES